MGTVNEKVYKVNIEGVEDVDKLKQSVDNLNGSLENTENQSNDTANSIGGLRRQLTNLKRNMEEMDTTSEEYANAMSQAAEMAHRLSDMQQQIRLSSPDVEDQLNNVRGIAANLAAGYSAVNAAMGLFGTENKEIKETLLKVQQAMALVQGLQGMAGFLKKTEGLSTAMKNWIKQTKTSTTELKKETSATQADTLAKGGQTVATNAATKAQKGLNAAMKANPIGFVIGAITALIAVMDIFSSKAKEKKEKEKEAAEESANETKDYIKDMEARSGANWKYTEEGIKAYKKDFETRANYLAKTLEGLYVGSEEYKEYIEKLKELSREENTYERDLADHKKKDLKDQFDWEVRQAKAVYDSKKKLDDDEYEYTKEYIAKRTKLYEDITTNTKLFSPEDIKKEQTEYLEFWNKYNEYVEKKRQERITKFKGEFEKYLDFANSFKMRSKDSLDVWNKGVADYKKYLMEVYNYTKEEADKLIKDLNTKKGNELLNSIVQNVRESLDKELNEIKTRAIEELDELKLDLEKKKLTIGFEIPQDYINEIEQTTDIELGKINDQLDKVNGRIKDLVQSYADANNISVDAAKDQLSASTEYQKMLETQKSLTNELVSLELTKFQQISDIRREEADRELEMIERNGEAQANAIKQQFELETLANERKREYGFMYGDNDFIQLDKEKENIEAYYKMYNDMFVSLITKYKEMSTNMELTAEERENALAEAARLGAEQEAMAMQKSIDLMDIEREKIKTLADTFKSAFASMQSSISSLMGSWNSLIDTEKQEINQELKAGRISEEEAERRHKANAEEFETFKNFQIAEAVINALASAVGAYQSMASIPYVGPYLGGLAAAAALAAGYAQVRQIQATTYDGNTSGLNSNYEYNLPDVMDLEPGRSSNNTDETDEDELNGGGGRSEGPIRAYVVQSDLEAAQKYSNKLNQETTF